MNWRWENFSPNEVLSPDGRAFLRRNVLKLQAHSLDRLQWYREFLRAPISINHGSLRYRGWRSFKENNKIGGRPDSYHCSGIAYDMTCYEAELSQFLVAGVKYSLEQANKTGGASDHRGFRAMGVYPTKNFIHGDFRSFAAPREDYMVLFNGEKRGTAFILKHHQMPKTLPGLLQLLKTELKLPGDWRL